MGKTLDLNGPLILALDEIRRNVPSNASGVFAIGHLAPPGTFLIASVGISYGSLRDDLAGKIGTASHFRFRVYEGHKQAFEKVCHMYHDFRPSGNVLHPARPRGAAWTCPRCSGLQWPTASTYR